MDPLSLGAIGGVALTEGIRFLYAQATDVLKRRRDRTSEPRRPRTPRSWRVASSR